MTAPAIKPPSRQMPLPGTMPTPPPAQARGKVNFGKLNQSTAGHRVVLYGPGGIGKTTLACSAPGPVAFIDLDESLSRLKGQLGENLPLPVEGINNWQALRTALQAEGWDSIKTIVIDTVTKAEELAVAHTLATVKNEKGFAVQSVEGYGFGKGMQHVFDTFLPLLGDLDQHCRAGRNVILICHDCTANVPNPTGEDWIRYEPRLQNPTSGKASIRLRLKEWSDHLLFVGYDIDVKDGVGKGTGTRTIWTAELPHCMAKSRTTQDIIPLTTGEEVWAQILK